MNQIKIQYTKYENNLHTMKLIYAFVALIGSLQVQNIHSFNVGTTPSKIGVTTGKTSMPNPPLLPSLQAASVQPLAQEGSWRAYLDDSKTGLIYYFNTITGEASWYVSTRSR